MTALRWDVPVEDDDQTWTERPLPTLVSLHFLRSALVRRWWVCALCALLGLLASAAFLVVSPASQAKAALVLAHDPEVDASRAMATDISLLKTRTVASRTIASLGLTMTPDEFLGSMTAEPVSSELLLLTFSAPTDAEATRRLAALTSIYLDFRAEQLSTQSNVLVDGMKQRIEKLQSDMTTLSRRIEQLSGTGKSGASKLADAIAQRASFQAQVETLQQSVEDATLRNASVISSSRLIDPAAVDTTGATRRTALILASGLIGGAALGCGIVLFFAITSDRLRRRSDVAAALEVPVPVSVGKIAPLPKYWLWFPRVRSMDRNRAGECQRLARAIEMELPVPGRKGRLAVACIDNSDEVRFAFAAAARDLAVGGRSVAVIDLTASGDLRPEQFISDSADRLTVLRPRGVPALAVGTADLRVVGHERAIQPSLERADVLLVLADLDPSVGADHLTAWTDRVVVVVTAGHSSAERVRTAADLVRAAALDLSFAALLRAERRDDSSGVAGFDRAPSVQRIDGDDQLMLEFDQPIDQDQDLMAETTLVSPAAQVADDERTEATDTTGSAGDQPQVAGENLDADAPPTIDDGQQTAEDATLDQTQQREQQAEELQPAETRSAETEEADAKQQPDAVETDTKGQATVIDTAGLATVIHTDGQVTEEQLTGAALQQTAETVDGGVVETEEIHAEQRDAAAEQLAEAEEAAEPEVVDGEMGVTERLDVQLADAEGLAAVGLVDIVEEGDKQEVVAGQEASKQQAVPEEQAEAAHQAVAYVVEAKEAIGEEQLHADLVEAEETDAELIDTAQPADEQGPAEIEQPARSELPEAQGQAEAEVADAGTPAEQTGVEEHAAEDQQSEEQVSAEHQVIEGQLTIEEQPADTDDHPGTELSAEVEQVTEEQPAEAVLVEPEHPERAADARESGEPELVAHPASETTLEGWKLYIDEHWDGSLDDPDHKQDSPANGEEAEAHVGEALTTSTNGKESRPLPEVGMEADDQAGAVQSDGHGQALNGGGEGTRTRRRSRRRNLKARVNRGSRRV